MSLQFQQKTAEKSYLALVRGGEKTFSETQGTIRASLLYDDGRPEIDPMGKESITEWEVLASSVWSSE
jgi:23S rRNA-/tRNA-specific pseudouridylate synthase